MFVCAGLFQLKSLEIYQHNNFKRSCSYVRVFGLRRVCEINLSRKYIDIYGQSSGIF